jgi:hypothetical protein
MRALVRILLAIISLLYGCVGGKAALIKISNSVPFTVLVPYLARNIVPCVIELILLQLRQEVNKKDCTMLVQRIYHCCFLGCFHCWTRNSFFFPLH